MSLQLLCALEQIIVREFPSFRVEFKNQSRLMRALATLVCPFNPTFLTNFTTTLGTTVYFPSRSEYEARAGESAVTLAHEFVHMYDRREAGIRFLVSYASPQVAAVPLLVLFGLVGSVWPLCIFLAGYVILVASVGRKVSVFAGLLAVVVVIAMIAAWLLAGWTWLILASAVVCLAPWPSPGRTHWEARGYTMNVAIQVWTRHGAVPDELLQDYIRYFTGPDYYFMCRDRAKAEALFAEAIRSAFERKLQREPPYSIIHAFLLEQGLISPAFRE